ncbi:hypothetical protein BDZ94DRAFT_1314761 [Collybia nuda]|uniref:Uncharacterized protein n=1 Tax=Collybia nuda TaxID=64659 RepID=A0A9P5XW76_9AGAR|nr:hypothetical protein BDZ94DRAFT_1314761 [Collybia nuda]
MAIEDSNVPSSSPSPLRRSARRLSDAQRPPTPVSTHKTKLTTSTNAHIAANSPGKQSPLAYTDSRRAKVSSPTLRENSRKREPPPSSPRASRAEKRRRLGSMVLPPSSPSPPTPVHVHTHALRKRKISTPVPPSDSHPSPGAGSSKRRKENAYKSPGRVTDEKDSKDTTRPTTRVLGCENPPVLGAKDQQSQDRSARRRSLRLNFPLSSASTSKSAPTSSSKPPLTPTSPLTSIPSAPARDNLFSQPPPPRKRGRPSKRLSGPPPSRTLVTSPPRPPPSPLPPTSAPTSPHTSPILSPTSPTSVPPSPFLLPLIAPTPLRRSTRLSLSITSSMKTSVGLRRPPTPGPPFEAGGTITGRGIVRPPTPRPPFEAGPHIPSPPQANVKKTASPLASEVVATLESAPPLMTPATRVLTPIPILPTLTTTSDACPECDPPSPIPLQVPADTQTAPKAKSEPEPELESERMAVVEPAILPSVGLVGPAVPPNAGTPGTGVVPPPSPTSPLTPTSPPSPRALPTPIVKAETEEIPATPHLPAAALPLPVSGRGQVPNLQIQIPEVDYTMLGPEQQHQQDLYRDQNQQQHHEQMQDESYHMQEQGQGQHEGQSQGQELHQQQQQPQIPWWEQPLHIEKDWTLWEVACRLRVWEIQKRYTPRTIRSVVAQEANDFYSTHGWRAPPHTHGHTHKHGHGSGPSSAEGSGSGGSGSEDWSEYESEFSDEDEDEDDEDDVGGAGDEWGDDPDAEGEPDPEVFPTFEEDDPSFNAELSSPTRSFGPEDGTAVGVGAGPSPGMMSAFYVPPSPVLDGMEGLTDRLGSGPAEGYAKDLALVARSPETPGPSQGVYGGQPHVQEPLLPLPPPRLGSIRVHALRQMEIGLAPFVGRGTPVHKGRAEEWATGKVGSSRLGEEVRGRSRERARWEGERWMDMNVDAGAGTTDMRMGMGESKNGLVLPGEPGPCSNGIGNVNMNGSLGVGAGFNTEPGEWEAFLESLERDGGASVVASANASVSGGGEGAGQMMDVECLVGDGCAPMSMSLPMPMSVPMPMQQNDLMGPGLGMNMNMNMSMVSPNGSSAGGGVGGGVDGMGMFGMGFGVGMGIGMAVGLGVGAGGAGIGWFGPEGEHQQQQQSQTGHSHSHIQHPHQHHHTHSHYHSHSHQLSPPVSPTSPVTPGFVLDGFDQPTSTLSFALG